MDVNYLPVRRNANDLYGSFTVIFCFIDDDSVDRCDISSFDDLFSQKSYGYDTNFIGLDHTALLGSSMALDGDHFMVGSSGFGE